MVLMNGTKSSEWLRSKGSSILSSDHHPGNKVAVTGTQEVVANKPSLQSVYCHPHLGTHSGKILETRVQDCCDG